MNNTTKEIWRMACAGDIPRSTDFLKDLPGWGKAILIIHIFICLLCVLLFIECVVFLMRKFHEGDRLNGTIWVLALFPVFSVTSLISLFVPRSGTLINLVANVYFASALYRLVGLMTNYLGGPNVIAKHVATPRPAKINTLPICCCCVCLPAIQLTSKNYSIIHGLVVQVAIVRPCAMFIAAVLWTNNDYVPGSVDLKGAFIYIAAVVLISTMLAMWGLVILKNAFAPELETKFKMSGKLISIQLMLISTALVNILCGILVTTNVIQCSPLLPSAARADSLYHQILNILALLYLLMARIFYRRLDDAEKHYDAISNESANKEVTVA